MPHVFKAGGNFTRSPALISRNCSAYSFPELLFPFTHMQISTKPRDSRGLLGFLQPSFGKAPSSPVLFPATSSYHGLPKCQVSSSLQQYCSLGTATRHQAGLSWGSPHSVYLLPGITNFCLPQISKAIISFMFYRFQLFKAGELICSLPYHCSRKQKSSHFKHIYHLKITILIKTQIQQTQRYRTLSIGSCLSKFFKSGLLFYIKISNSYYSVFPLCMHSLVYCELSFLHETFHLLFTTAQFLLECSSSNNELSLLTTRFCTTILIRIPC